MKLKFSIHYHTEWGQMMHVLIRYTTHDGREHQKDLEMQTQDGECWTLETTLMASRQRVVSSFIYNYQLEDQEGHVLRKEWGRLPRRYGADATKTFVFPDEWRDMPLHSHLYTKVFQYQIPSGDVEKVPESFSKGTNPQHLPLFRKTIIFRVSAPQLRKGECVALIGNHPALGSWNPTRYHRMENHGEYEWRLSVNVDGMQLPLEYKYVVVDEKTNRLRAWEEGDNRTTSDYEVNDGEVLVLDGGSLHLKEDTWKAAGVVVPVFSLRSEHSYGVGDFGDLLRLIDWAALTGMRMIQLLPVNDTTTTHSWTDSHPYNAVSCFALHPHYLDLEQLGDLPDEERMKSFVRQRRELNTHKDSDYLAVDRVKEDYIDAAFEAFGEDTFRSDDYRRFEENNREWLFPYAVFCVLRDSYHTARFTDWPQLASYDETTVMELCKEASPYYLQIRRICYVQYHLHRQLRRASDYAHHHGVSLKGDLPIGVYRDSVETWRYPEFFHFDEQMGTPPDLYAPNGQNWGFPTYRWEENGIYDWWRRRFRWMEQYFDAFRIDHVVGFFRSWAIPEEAIFGTLGHFSPSLPLTEVEIGATGLVFRKDMFTQPFINDKVVEKIFGIHAQYVRDHCLDRKPYGLYRLKPAYSSQKKIREQFHERHDENSLWIRDGLYRLTMNVLFLEDIHQKGMYHPRYGVYNEPVYDVLDKEEKEAFMRLYNSYYYERHQDFWAWQATRKLSAILRDTKMLACAEDLGMLPSCVQQVLDSLRILTLEVQGMPKQYGYEFAHLDAYPYRSVATITTHDMSPMRLWWAENAGKAQRYYTTMLQKEGRAPQQMPATIAEEIIARHLYCPSMLCLLSLQDWLAMDSTLRSDRIREERVNCPYDSYHQWKYRMHLTIEELLRAKQLNMKIKTMITRSKR